MFNDKDGQPLTKLNELTNSILFGLLQRIILYSALNLKKL